MLRRALLRGRISLLHPTFGLRAIVKSLVAVPAYTAVLPFALVAGQSRFMCAWSSSSTTPAGSSRSPASTRSPNPTSPSSAAPENQWTTLSGPTIGSSSPGPPVSSAAASSSVCWIAGSATCAASPGRPPTDERRRADPPSRERVESKCSKGICCRRTTATRRPRGVAVIFHLAAAGARSPFRTRS